MAQQIFQRYEKKYMLSGGQYKSLMRGLMGKMTADSYGKHRISNIYFDTPNYELIRRSIEKPNYKEKLRLRAYGAVEEGSLVYVELKKKCQGVVYKRRIQLPLPEARDYLYGGIYPEKDCQILREIDYAVKRYGLEPKAYVAYDRTAFFGKENRDLRVTFDRNIQCRSWLLDLERNSQNTDILRDDEVLMEVKIPGAMPVWMSEIFSRLKIFPCSFSKYGTYYKRYLYKDVENQTALRMEQRAIEGGVYCA